VTVEPWPVGVRSVLTIRHDVDRPVEPAAWERLLRWESAAGVRASWYFLERTAEPDRVRDVAALGHEVAYHYTHLRSVGERELAAVRAAARGAGTEIEGACCHGGNFHAMADVDWLQQQGLAYGELLTRCAPFPFRPVRGAEPRDGRAGAAAASDVSDAPPRRDVRARPCRLLATARHLSVDLKVAPPTADFDFGRRTMPARHRLGAHLIVMNHPDINFEALVDAVGAARRPEQESWTQAEVIDWWRASHLDGAQLERWPTDAGPALHLVHRADRPPVLRIWAEVEGVEDAWTDESFGAVHTLCPATSTIPLAACAGAVSRG
jgi:hypothetical protein